MSASAIFGVSVVPPQHSAALSSRICGAGNLRYSIPLIGVNNGGGLTIECSSRPKKKATAHHVKTRPRKTQPWDIKRKPTVYPPLPPLPPDWTLVSDAAEESTVPLAPAPVEASVTSSNP